MCNVDYLPSSIQNLKINICNCHKIFFNLPQKIDALSIQNGFIIKKSQNFIKHKIIFEIAGPFNSFKSSSNKIEVITDYNQEKEDTKYNKISNYNYSYSDYDDDYDSDSDSDYDDDYDYN